MVESHGPILAAGLRLPDAARPTGSRSPHRARGRGEWGLELGTPFRSRTTPSSRRGGDAVLKVTPARRRRADEEPDALVLWDGDAPSGCSATTGPARTPAGAGTSGTDISELPETSRPRSQSTLRRGPWRPAGEPSAGSETMSTVARPASAPTRRPRSPPRSRDLYATLDVGPATWSSDGDFHHHNPSAQADGRARPSSGDRPQGPLGSWSLTSPPPPQSLPRRGGVTAPARLPAFETRALDEERMLMWVIRCAYLGRGRRGRHAGSARSSEDRRMWLRATSSSLWL